MGKFQGPSAALRALNGKKFVSDPVSSGCLMLVCRVVLHKAVLYLLVLPI